MQKQIFIGIDVSSATLDICVRQEHSLESFVITNQTKDIQRFFKSYSKAELIIGMENTGRYNWPLYDVLTNTEHKIFVLSPLHLKKSIGLVRGKNDKVDAERIACYIEKHYKDLKPWKATSASIQKIRILLTERSFRIKSKSQLRKQQQDYAKMKKLGLDRSLTKLNEQLILQLEKQIATLEAQIEAIINADEALNNQASLIQTVPGVGKVLCWTMLAKTEGFTTIDNPRKMACYSGVVPFDYQSGTSIRGKHRVSSYADKTIKSILHLAAMSAIRLNNDLRQYYLKKVAEGKNKMSVLNAIRNKIIHRIFAVIKNQKEYLVLS